MSAAIDDKRARAFVTGARHDGERKFARARRHSRIVRFLRPGLPGAVLGIFGLYFLVSYLNPLHLLGQLPQGGGLVVSGTKIAIVQPRLAGFTRDSRAYEMTARAAAQDITNPDKLELEGVHAKFETPDRAMINVTADTGLYDQKADVLQLNRNVLITSTNGYEAVMSEAVIDIRNNHLVSEKPVTVKMINGTINANRAEVLDNGDTIRFSGGITMNVISPPAPANATAANEPNEP